MWSVIGIILLSLLGLLGLVLVSPVVARIRYDEELTVCVRVLGIPVYRYSSAKPKREKPKKTDKPAGSKKQPKEEKPSFFADLAKRLKSDGVGAAVAELKELANEVVGAVRRVARCVVVDRLQLELVIASEDAAATAINSGRVCAVLYPSLTAIQSVVRIRRRAVTVVPDYLAEKGSVRADILLHSFSVQLVWAALRTLMSYFALQSRKSTKTKEESENGK